MEERKSTTNIPKKQRVRLIIKPDKECYKHVYIRNCFNMYINEASLPPKNSKNTSSLRSLSPINPKSLSSKTPAETSTQDTSLVTSRNTNPKQLLYSLHYMQPRPNYQSSAKLGKGKSKSPKINKSKPPRVRLLKKLMKDRELPTWISRQANEIQEVTKDIEHKRDFSFEIKGWDYYN